MGYNHLYNGCTMAVKSSVEWLGLSQIMGVGSTVGWEYKGVEPLVECEENHQ